MTTISYRPVGTLNIKREELRESGYTEEKAIGMDMSGAFCGVV